MRSTILTVRYKSEADKEYRYELSHCFVKDGFLYMFPNDGQSNGCTTSIARPVSDIAEYTVKEYR